MRWWPFRSRPVPRTPVAVLGSASQSPEDYTVLTVGQSRLQESFVSLDMKPGVSPIFSLARLTPVMDEQLGIAADVTIEVDGQLVGYLRPPAVREVMAALDQHHADSLDVPAVLEWGPAGAEVRLRRWVVDES